MCIRDRAEPLAKAGGSIRLDLTLAGEMEYYNGLIFQGYLRPLPRPLLKGGRYDLLMQKFTPGADAIGFAVYLDCLLYTSPVRRVGVQDKFGCSGPAWDLLKLYGLDAATICKTAKEMLGK